MFFLFRVLGFIWFRVLGVVLFCFGFIKQKNQEN